MRILMIFVGGILISCILSVIYPLNAQDQRQVEGQDHPLLTRFPGSTIIRYSSVDFDELLIPLGKATGIDEFEESERVEGKITRITYEIGEDHSTLEVLSSYRQALAKKGFDILYSCALEECGGHLNFQNLERPFIIAKDHRYLAAKGNTPQGNFWVSVRVYTTSRQNPPVRAMIGIAEVKAIEKDLILVNAEAMAEAIETSGHVALYGVYFDSGKAEIKPDSETTLEQMAKLLKKNPDLMVFVVGHTDNVGTIDYNMGLSQRRAQAVVEELIQSYSIDSKRLNSKGVGPFAPVASNRTEKGKAMNRRVELVEQ